VVICPLEAEGENLRRNAGTLRGMWRRRCKVRPVVVLRFGVLLLLLLPLDIAVAVGVVMAAAGVNGAAPALVCAAGKRLLVLVLLVCDGGGSGALDDAFAGWTVVGESRWGGICLARAQAKLERRLRRR
jgi:hypothetical protein